MNENDDLDDDQREQMYIWSNVFAAWLIDIADGDTEAAKAMLKKAADKDAARPEPYCHPDLFSETDEHIDDLAKKLPPPCL